MDLSSPKLKKILIFAAIFTVIVFIVVKVWRRSYYSYPNTGEDTQVIVTAMSGGAGPDVTVTTAGHNFKVNDIVLLKGVGVTITTTAGVMPTVTATNAQGGSLGTPVVVASIATPVGAAPSASFTFSGTYTGTFTANGTAEGVGNGVMTVLKSALVACQDTYAIEVINPPTPPATAAGNRTNCITNAVAPYTRGHCRWLPQQGSSTIPVPLATDTLAKAAYDQYQLDIKTIQVAYVQAANRAAAGTFTGISDTTRSGDIVSAARAADISGATRKYLAKVCPGFYQPGDPAVADPSVTAGSTYIAWTAVQGATDALSAGTQKHFYAATAGITDAAILTWAQYARTVTFVVGSGLTASTGYLATSVSTYTDKSGLTGGTSNGENWRLAYENGPGTFPAPTWKTTA